MQVFFKSIQPEISEFIFKKKFLPKEDTFWQDASVPSLKDFQNMLSQDKFKSDSDFTQKIIDFLDAMMKIEKKHLGISI
jgi:hypothetical protein